MNSTQDSPSKTPLRIFTIGDPHFKESNPGQTQSMTKRIVEIAKERKPDLIICLGDVLDRHAKLHTDPLCEAIKFFRQLSEIAHLCILIGNHDRRSNTDYLTDRHPFTAVKYWDGVTVVDQTKFLYLNGHLITLVPYVFPGRFIEAMDDFFLQEDSESLLAAILGSEFTSKAKGESEFYSSAKKIARKILSSPHLSRLLISKSKILSKIEDKAKRDILLTRIIVESWFYPTDLLSLLALRSKFITETMDELQQNLLKSEILPVILSSFIFRTAEKQDGNQKSDTMDDPGETEEMEETIPDCSGRWWWKSSIIFAHQEFRGAKMGAIISEVGDLWPLNGPLVISGHIHDHQKVQENVWYTGTPIQHGFGDTSGKTISLMSWSNADNGWEEERIDLGLIKRKTFRMGALDLIAWTPPKGFLLKVVISGTPGELRTLKALYKIHTLRKNGIVVTIKTLADKPLLITSSSGVKYSSVSYLIALWKEVSRDDRMKLWFKNIFGGSAHLDKLVTLMTSEEENLSRNDFPVEVGQILDYLLSDTIPKTSSDDLSVKTLEKKKPVQLLVINRSPPKLKHPVPIRNTNHPVLIRNTNQPGITLMVSNSS
uniref:DNA repair exonuclease n=1 Tax=Pithovirus LCPAC202 TaxID=2506592 RepID=A0A481Z6P3_9VIRU|nr:MAG: DNA repair exonuclease [Pithovirus LCPAC202]